MIAAIGGVGLVDQAAAAGSPTISSSRKGASVSSVMELARRTANSSFHSSGMAPMSRTMASSFCKMPTTSVLRLISLFGRSHGGAESSRGENQRRRPCPCGREGSSSHWSSVGSSLANRLSRKIADARQKPLARRAAPWQAASRAACFRQATMNPTILHALEWQLHLVYPIIILALHKFGKTRYRNSIDPRVSNANS
jgi:hypothetical protein